MKSPKRKKSGNAFIDAIADASEAEAKKAAKKSKQEIIFIQHEGMMAVKLFNPKKKKGGKKS